MISFEKCGCEQKSGHKSIQVTCKLSSRCIVCIVGGRYIQHVACDETSSLLSHDSLSILVLVSVGPIQSNYVAWEEKKIAPSSTGQTVLWLQIANYKANNNHSKSVSFSGQFGNLLFYLIFTLAIYVIHFAVTYVCKLLKQIRFTVFSRFRHFTTYIISCFPFSRT